TRASARPPSTESDCSRWRAVNGLLRAFRDSRADAMCGDEQYSRADSMRNISIASATIALLAGCGVSTQQEVQMGQQEAQQVNAQLPIVQDAIIQNYVNSLGQRIASRTSRGDLNWQFQVVNSDVVNAFALPGGFVYV